ncbi:cation diffusion facilitator family transporter [Dyella sp.]|uniref:cation diffusion facilitator family transporter n=1 Tax=Dyella sp. TaxID=1869338 RepID=UPI002D792235|nr:cation diffusion facilitator family transporter [Dyella sp.]
MSRDSKQSTGTAEHGERSKAVVWAALAGNLAIAISKTVAAIFTGSSALWSEAVHSLVDTGNQWLMLLGMRRAARPPSESHPFGHGLELYFWSFVVAIMIFGLGAGVSVYQGIAKILHPEPMRYVWVNYLVLGISTVFEGAVWLFALREFRKDNRRYGWIKAIRFSKDPTVFTVLFEDTAALLGLLVALAGIAMTQWTNNTVYDGLASVVIGLILAATATLLANECRGLLTGEAATKTVREKLHQLICGDPSVIDVHRVLTMHFAPHDVLVAASIKFKDELTVPQLEGAIADIEAAIRKNHPEIRRIFLEPRRKPSEAAQRTQVR